MNELFSSILEGAGAFFLGLLFLAWLAVIVKKCVYQYMYEHAPRHTPPASAEPVTLSTEDRSFINELVADL